MAGQRSLDALDVALVAALRGPPRAGALELSRITGVARATVSARLQRLEDDGVVTGYGPDVDVAAAGFGVQAFVTLEIAQGALKDVDRKSTRLNSSHANISYAVFCLKKKKYT